MESFFCLNGWALIVNNKKFWPALLLSIFLTSTTTTATAGLPPDAAMLARWIGERQFQNPDTVDIAREPNKHLAFGLGAHFCLGAPLARLEGQLAINTLLRRLPDPHLTLAPSQIRWQRGLLLRGLETLPLAFA